MFQPHKSKLDKKVRLAKYWIAKKLGYNAKFCHRVRDWRLTKIASLIKHRPNLPGSRT